MGLSKAEAERLAAEDFGAIEEGSPGFTHSGSPPPPVKVKARKEDLIGQVMKYAKEVKSITKTIVQDLLEESLGSDAFASREADQIGPLYKFLTEDAVKAKAIISVYKGMIMDITAGAFKMSGTPVHIPDEILNIIIAASLFCRADEEDKKQLTYDITTAFTIDEEKRVIMRYRLVIGIRPEAERSIVILDPSLLL